LTSRAVTLDSSSEEYIVERPINNAPVELPTQETAPSSEDTTMVDIEPQIEKPTPTAPQNPYGYSIDVETTQIHPYKVRFNLKINTFATKPLVPPNSPLHLSDLKWDTLSDFECDIIQCLALISYKRGNLLVAEATGARDQISVRNPEATWVNVNPQNPPSINKGPEGMWL
jgi:hypothetical protein